ncbi:MAG TPA: DUF2723 domain-containing protein [Verrucomicrobiae bacterium]|nr:DUF2723 domain-containing protein [Verrucomicrobiae bacterium]
MSRTSRHEERARGRQCDNVPGAIGRDPLTAAPRFAGRSERSSRSLPRPGTGALAATGVFTLALLVYVRTLVPGPTFGDWAEMQFVPAELGIPHPTGYPLYILLGKLFSYLPFGTLAIRAELLSAASAAAASGACVLIAMRLGVRPVIAIAAGLALAVTGTLWLEATYSEMNSLHLLLMAAVIHRALVWRDERRDRDLLLGALIAGLSFSNHLLAVTCVPIVILFVLFDARSRLAERPVLLLQAALLFVAGLLPYLFIPIRALFGPASIYGRFLTWDGFSTLVTGAEFRGDMHFTSGESLAKAWRDVPDVLAQLQARSDLVYVIGGLVGLVVLLLRDRWVALMLGLVVAGNIFIFANYVGDLEHYLLVTWLVFAIGAAVAGEAIVGWLERRLPNLAEAPGPAVIALVLPIVIGATNWSTYDESQNHTGDQFAEVVLGQLPPNAVLLSYWDALTNLSYVHCVEGERPDVSLRAFDDAARMVCDPVTATLDETARERPLYALFVTGGEIDQLRASFDLVAGPRLPLPYGRRELDHSGILYRVLPKGTAATWSPAGG